MKMKLKLFYYFNSEAYAPEDEISISTFERSKAYRPKLVFIKTVDIDVPDVEKPSREFIVKELVSALEDENKRIQAAAYVKIQQNENKIKQFLCIENKEPA
jgi:hypothetical protein